MGTPLRALIVEDNPNDIELLLMHLRRGGYEVTYRTVETQTAMHQALAAEPWDVVLSDHRMPQFSSAAALTTLKEMQLDIPFIIVSGAIGEEDAVRVMRAGCHDYVMKTNMVRLAPAIQREMREAQVRRERRVAEAALKESEARLLQVIESLSIVFLSVEHRTNAVLLAMGPVQDIFGCDQAALQADHGLLLQAVIREDVDRLRELLDEGLATRKPFDLEYRVRHARLDRPIWVYQRVVPIVDPAGALVRHDSVVMDITDQKQAEEERERMQSQLFHAQKLESIGVLAGGIAHDFNNLLTIISGNAQYLGRTLALDPDQAAVIKDIETAAAHAAEMTRSLQAFSRPSKPHIRHTDANELVQQVYRLLHRMIPSTIEFRLDLAPSPCMIAVDPAQMQQVLVNLCVNARDAMPVGGLLVMETRRVDRQALPAMPHGQPLADHYVLIRVKDTGCGMDEATLQRAFDPFFTTKPHDRGTGLGLSTVYTIVMAHEGAINVTSAPAEGAQFDIFFPAAEAVPEDQVVVQIPASQGQEHILVVENENMVASLIRTILESRGYHVTLSHEPQQALDLARRAATPFDLAIVGYALPHMTGDRFLAALQEACQGIKAILITGYDINENDPVASHCRILHKPFSVPAMAALVRDVLDGPPAPSQPDADPARPN